MGGPWDGKAHEVDRPDLPYRVVVPVDHDDVGVRVEQFTYQGRRYVLPAHAARPAGHPGWCWVMVPGGSTLDDCNRLIAEHSPPVVDGTAAATMTFTELCAAAQGSYVTPSSV